MRIKWLEVKQNNMKEWISKYQKAIVGTGAVSVLLICSLQQKELSKLRAEVKVQKEATDSIQAENFPCQIELGRYQVAYQILLERNPKAAKEYGDIISDETE
jgi:hypothetical protein